MRKTEFKPRKTQFVILLLTTMNLGTSFILCSFKGSWRDIEKYLWANIQWLTLNSSYPAASKPKIISYFLCALSPVLKIFTHTNCSARYARLVRISIASIWMTNLCLEPMLTLTRAVFFMTVTITAKKHSEVHTIQFIPKVSHLIN